MTIKQLLQPSYNIPLTHSLSITGVCKLKERSAKNRFTGSRSTKILTNGEIITNKEATIREKKRTDAKGTTARKGTPKNRTNDEGNPKTIQKATIREYSINKYQVRHRISQQLQQQKGYRRLYLITVTFPLKIPDDIAYKLLNNWLTTLRTAGLLHNYIWIAERQKNGTIHYHIAIPHYINIKEANKKLQVSITNEVRKGHINWSISASKKYNGVDISKDRNNKKVTNFGEKKKTKSLSGYLTKYITKNTTRSERRVWGCSREYSAMILKIWLTYSEFQALNLWQKSSADPIFSNEFCNFHSWSNAPPQLVISLFTWLNHSISLVVANEKTINYKVYGNFGKADITDIYGNLKRLKFDM
jgi:hypothetical protein